DRTVRLVLADWFEERGEAGLARGMRESVEKDDWVYLQPPLQRRWRESAPWDNCIDGWPGLKTFRVRKADAPDGWANARTIREGIEALAPSQWVLAVWLAGRDVTDDVLPGLAKYPNLVVVDLFDASVTDEGMKHLAALPRLHRLEIDYQEPITDAGL